jgi:hypothetical protein
MSMSCLGAKGEILVVLWAIACALSVRELASRLLEPGLALAMGRRGNKKAALRGAACSMTQHASSHSRPSGDAAATSDAQLKRHYEASLSSSFEVPVKPRPYHRASSVATCAPLRGARDSSRAHAVPRQWKSATRVARSQQ